MLLIFQSYQLWGLTSETGIWKAQYHKTVSDLTSQSGYLVIESWLTRNIVSLAEREALGLKQNMVVVAFPVCIYGIFKGDQLPLNCLRSQTCKFSEAFI